MSEEMEKYMDSCMREFCVKCISWNDIEKKCNLKKGACVMGDEFRPKEEQEEVNMRIKGIACQNCDYDFEEDCSEGCMILIHEEEEQDE